MNKLLILTFILNLTLAACVQSRFDFSTFFLKEKEKSIWLKTKVFNQFNIVLRHVFSQKHLAIDDIEALMYFAYRFKLKLDEYMLINNSPPIYWYTRKG